MSTNTSNLGLTVLTLHDEAERLGHIDRSIEKLGDLHEYAKAQAILRVLRAKQFKVKDWHRLPGHIQSAVELRQGRVNSDEAKMIRNEALVALIDYGTFLLIAERLGYTTHVVRAALSIHWERLREEDIGSDGNCIRVDLLSALSRACEDTRKVAAALIAKEGPQQLSKELGVNGSRMVSRALYELSGILEGRC